VHVLEWVHSDQLTLDWVLRVDTLTAVMLVVVTTVSSVVHVYSIGYMVDDPHQPRFFAYLSLFTFSMLMLVTADNFLQLFFGWEGVGLSSYLLIGFWYDRPAANAAAIKAFVVNRVGDFGFALGIFGAFAVLGHINFDSAFAAVPAHQNDVMHFLWWQWPALEVVCLLLFMGAMGKSAQFLLHTWLPDAMEGPTPVSALIHAATMVTAGVYLIARTHPIFEQARTVELVAAGLGALTLVVAGLVALVQVDIKRVIAYSTMSQIGYMFLGAGVGAYANGMFHLMTHAFFKALLFMGAGVAIHALGGEQDIRKMRGVGALMPWTKWAFLAGSLALVGIPPFSGFFSKDSIIAAAMTIGWYGWFLWAAALAGAFLTGLYTFRLYFLVFRGEPSPFVREHHHTHHGKEGPWTMMAPVVVLAVLAVIGGWLQFAPIWTPLTSWLEPVARTLPVAEPTSWQEGISSALAVGLGVAGIVVAWLVYGAGRIAVPRVAALQRLFEHKFWFDELYDAIFYKPAVLLSNVSRREIEEPVVLAAGPDIGETAFDTGRGVRRLQTGLLRTYVFFLGSGMAVLAIVFLLTR
jgi:NADH-quinone oxidoreductase subunit L